MNKHEALNEVLDQIKKYGFISEDGVLDICDEDRKLVNYVHEQLIKMIENNELTKNEYDVVI